MRQEDVRWGHYKQTDTSIGVMDRYQNIKPWNHNRVKLQVEQGKLDYVNASTVELPSTSDPTQTPHRYIAMQGPTEPSFSHVWRMIAEQIQGPAVIVQLTNMYELISVKCSQYFPDGENEVEYHLNTEDAWQDSWRARLVFDSSTEHDEGAITKRKFLLHIDGEDEPRVIWHIHYHHWPDFGLPKPENLPAFFALSHMSQECAGKDNPSAPRIVHCSAGVGRTGTFIALEHLMRELELGAMHPDKKMDGDPVYDTVELLRKQRRGMVQGETQLRFIYQTIRRLWLEKYGHLVGLTAEDGEPASKRLEVSGGAESDGDREETDPFVWDPT